MSRRGRDAGTMKMRFDLHCTEEAVARLKNEGETVVLVSADGRLTGLVAIAASKLSVC